jgi:nitrite reductase/ring-hydroxylating ferredoxin subunit
MNRYNFLKNLGLRGAALMAVMTGCVNEEDTYVEALTLNANGQSTTGPVSATVAAPASATGTAADVLAVKNPLLKLDLTTTAALKNVGGYIARSGYVVAQVSAGVYVAVTQTCSHEPKKQIILNSNEFYCTAHGARFNLNGTGKNSLGSRGITLYKVITDGKTLVVYL